MLDIEASFAPVPEFHTTGSLIAERALLSHDRQKGVEILTSAVNPANAMPECAIAGPAVKLHLPPAQSEAAEPLRHSQGIAALFAAPPSESLPDLASVPPNTPVPQAQVEDAPALSFRAAAPTQGDTQPEARPITPRRPMRFTFARETGEPTPVAPPAFNLFAGVFQEDSLEHPDLDPRLRRSRERAMARIAAHEAALPPEARNLWFDDAEAAQGTSVAIAEASLSSEASPPSVESDVTHPRRVVRHICVKRRAEEAPAPAATIRDPLQDHLHRIREALYTVDPSDQPESMPQLSLADRLIAILLHLAVLFSTLPERLAQFATPLLPGRQRDFSLRLGTAASLGAATVMALAGTGHHLLS